MTTYSYIHRGEQSGPFDALYDVADAMAKSWLAYPSGDPRIVAHDTPDSVRPITAQERSVIEGRLLTIYSQANEVYMEEYV